MMKTIHISSVINTFRLSKNLTRDQHHLIFKPKIQQILILVSLFGFQIAFIVIQFKTYVPTVFSNFQATSKLVFVSVTLILLKAGIDRFTSQPLESDIR